MNMAVIFLDMSPMINHSRRGFGGGAIERETERGNKGKTHINRREMRY